MRILITTLALLFLSSNVWAFGQDGHRIVCQMALAELSGPARAEISRLLDLDPDFSEFSEACLWADTVRNTTHRFTRGWHCINLDQDDLIVDPGDCPVDRGCVLHGINVHLATLKNDAASDAEKLEALKFLGHWIGDLHQPLHISFFEDFGGNQIEIRWLDRKDTNLHSVWDTQMILTYQREQFADVTAADRWKELAAELVSEISFSNRANWRQGSPVNWGQESYNITLDPGVRYVELDESTRHPLGRDYFERNFPIVSERLQKAAIRLAMLLEDALTQ